MMTHPANSEPAADDLERLVTRLVAARRVLVTGLDGASVEAATAACDLAEALGAAVDFGSPDLDSPAGPTIARAGAVTAAPEEMRDRADVVILWGDVPPPDHPTIAGLMPRAATVIGMPPAGASAFDAARLLHHLVRGGPAPANGEAWAAACVVARDAIARAACVAIVSADSSDRLGLERWAVALLVREIAHLKPAFEVRLPDAGQAAAAVCTWRYGAAGAIARADRAGGRFHPAEASARRLIERREIDCVLAVGRVVNLVEAALARCADGVDVIRITAEPAALRAVGGALAARLRGDAR